MKKIILSVGIAFISLTASAAPTQQEFKFQFKASTTASFEIKKQAPSKDIAFKLAAKECFQQLTGGHYPGEERGLDIIDICANPKM